MNTINITPVAVGLNQAANAVLFQIQTLNLPPTEFIFNARFFWITNNIQKEVANVPFLLPIEDYNNWNSDVELENKCLSALSLQRNGL